MRTDTPQRSPPGGVTYESLGLRPLINCKGTYTIISGSLMLPEAREAIKRRELRLSRYSFGPAHDASQESVEDATLKQIRRIARYQRYGFELHAGL